MSVSEWADLMPHTISFAAALSRDGYGKQTFGAPASYAARVVYRPYRVRNTAGEEVVARGKVWIGGYLRISPEDQLTLPDSSTPPILYSEAIPDEEGGHHTVVYFG